MKQEDNRKDAEQTEYVKLAEHDEQDDRALWEMIQEIESGELLQAPAYLKREILETVETIETAQKNILPDHGRQENAAQEHEDRQETARRNTKPKARNIGKSRLRRKMEWIGYALEVGAVTAAAVALVLMMPAQEDESGLRERKESAQSSAWDSQHQYSEQWEQEAEARQQISDAASEFTRKIVTWGSFLLPGEEEDMR